ncbi:MAG: adenosylcobinamide-GDP ribazoletransferase [Roseovarius sp.]|nr:adenosylcobinamide-GDP ribazoletransferase [Roseovarius sp.]
MKKNRTPMASWNDVPLALSLLTRFPFRNPDMSRGAHASWAYPLAGLPPALLASAVAMVANWMGLPSMLVALLALTALIFSTGAMHEDGLADMFDGFWGAQTADKRLEIMKDSHIGAYGAIAIAVSLFARWAGLWLVFDFSLFNGCAAMMCAAMLSRASMPLLMSYLPNARNSGLSHSVGRAPAKTACLGAAIALALSFPLAGWAVMSAVFWAALATMAIGAIAQRKIGGQTGDVLGSAQQLSEIAVLLSLSP